MRIRELLIFSILLIAATAIITWLLIKKYTPKEVVYQRVEIPVEIQKIEKVEVPIERIKVIPKEKIKYKYIPQEVKNDRNREVAAVGETKCPKCDDKEAAVVTVAAINKESKEVELYSRVEIKEKIFQLFPKGEIGVRYGLHFDKDLKPGTEVVGYGRYDIVRFKNLFIGVGGEIGSAGYLYGYVRAEF